jgi:hypothetical protein
MLLLTGAPCGTDYQVRLDGTEVGAAWKKTARESGKAYLSVKRVSPFLAVPINCAFDGAGGRQLSCLWGSDKRKQDWPAGAASRPFPFQSWHDDDANFAATE